MRRRPRPNHDKHCQHWKRRTLTTCGQVAEYRAAIPRGPNGGRYFCREHRHDDDAEIEPTLFGPPPE